MNPDPGYTFLPNSYLLLWLYPIILIFLLLLLLCFPITSILATCYSFFWSHTNTFNSTVSIRICLIFVFLASLQTTVTWSLSLCLILKITCFYPGVSFSIACSISYMGNYTKCDKTMWFLPENLVLWLSFIFTSYGYILNITHNFQLFQAEQKHALEFVLSK